MGLIPQVFEQLQKISKTNYKHLNSNWHVIFTTKNCAPKYQQHP